MTKSWIRLSAGLALALSSCAALAATVLYGGLGGLGLAGGSTNDGSLVIIGQTDASIQVVGHPAGVGRLSGLAFALDGTLYGATQGATGGPPPPSDPSNLIRIDPATGALIASVPITDGQTNISIADLAVQPGTGILFAIRRDGGGLYTINTSTGLATLRGNTGAFAASIAFAPDGTLYMSSRNMVDTVHTFKRIDPATGATLSSVVTLYFFGGLAVRPSDGVIFGSLGSTGELHTIDPATGVSTLVGKTGTNYPGALTFGTGPDSSNYQGLWWKAPGGSEDGWGINFAHQGNVIFGTWFTYDTTGKGWWLTLITDTNPSPGVFTAKLYATTGPPFNTVPFVKTGGPPPPIGSATLNFTDANNASFHYDVNLPAGTVSQTKAITRQPLGGGAFATCASGANLATASNYQDIWWAGTSANPGTEQGWGINFAQQGGTMFASWFTYDLDGTPLWLVATLAPGIPGNLYRPSGPRFDAYDKNQFNANAPVGTMTVTFADGNNASFNYTVQLAGMTSPVTQTKPITRQLFSAAGTACR